MFRIITSNFAEVDPDLLASLHDTPWTMIKLAHVARKQGLTEVCLNSLSKLYSVATMDVQVMKACTVRAIFSSGNQVFRLTLQYGGREDGRVP